MDSSICSEDMWTYFDEEIGKEVTEIEPIISIFPMRTENISLENIHHQIPDNLSRIYTETIKSFHQGFYILCACGLRTIMDGVCSDLGIQDGPKIDKNGKRKTDLDSKIAGLFEK